MQPPAGWQNPIRVPPGQWQYGVDPLQLLPGRDDLLQSGLDLQRSLHSAGIPRFSPIQVTPDGVIWDGHHAARIAAEDGRTIDIRVVGIDQPVAGHSILDLPVR